MELISGQRQVGPAACFKQCHFTMLNLFKRTLFLYKNSVSVLKTISHTIRTHVVRLEVEYSDRSDNVAFCSKEEAAVLNRLAAAEWRDSGFLPGGLAAPWASGEVGPWQPARGRRGESA
jgi:hypothetical protein